jgi:hypothetical protein
MVESLHGRCCDGEKEQARGRKRVTKDLAPRRQAKGGKGEIDGLEPQAAHRGTERINAPV